MTKIFKRLFLENLSSKQTVAKNTFWLVLAEIVSRLLGLILVVYVARILGATDYGKFTFAFSFASILAILCDLGVSDILTREFSRDKENEKKLAGILGLEIILCIFALIVSLASSFFITADSQVRQAIWILTLFVITNSFFGIIFAFLRARQKMEYEAGIKIFQAFFNLLLVFVVIFKIPSIINLSYGYLLSNLIVLVFSLLYFNFYFQKIGISFKKNIFEILKISWPLSLGLMIGWIYMSIDSVMLGAFGLITENGWYNAASRIAIVAILPASLIVKSFYPTLSRFFVSSKENLQKAWNYFTISMIVLAVPIVIEGITLSERIISAFYGLEFYPAGMALQLLIVAVGISLMNYPYSLILVVADQQKKNFRLMAGGAILNIILNFVFVPIYGFYGVIVATIISCTTVLFFTFIFSRKLTPIKPINKEILESLVLSLVAGAFMFLIIKLISATDLNIIIACMIYTLSYFVALICLFAIFSPSKLKFS